MKSITLRALLVMLLPLCMLCQTGLVHASKLRDISSIAGVRSNQLIGYGLVVGLDGSGDQTTQTPFTLQTTLSLLQALGVKMPEGQRVQLRNTAAVMVTATLPPFARPGQNLDVSVSSIGNAKTLRGGMLLLTPPPPAPAPGTSTEPCAMA